MIMNIRLKKKKKKTITDLNAFKEWIIKKEANIDNILIIKRHCLMIYTI